MSKTTNELKDIAIVIYKQFGSLNDSDCFVERRFRDLKKHFHESEFVNNLYPIEIRRIERYLYRIVKFGDFTLKFNQIDYTRVYLPKHSAQAKIVEGIQ